MVAMAEKRREDRFRVEAGQAEPFDRAIAMHQRRAFR
jgi:hypothetical protein